MSGPQFKSQSLTITTEVYITSGSDQGVLKDGTDVGQDLNSTVSDRYKVPFKFTGKFNKVTIRYGE